MRHSLGSLIFFGLAVCAFPEVTRIPFAALNQQATDAVRNHSWAEAETLFRAALSRLVDSSSADAAIIWNELGEVHMQQRRFRDAEQDFFHALAINQQLHSPDITELAISVNNLGSIGILEGRLSDAEHHFRESLGILQQNPSNKQMQVPVLTNLGLVLQKEGQYDAARHIYSEGIAAGRCSSEEAIPYCAKLLMDYGLLSYQTGNYRDALEKDTRAEEIGGKLAHIPNRDRATLENNMGSALLELDAYPDAEQRLTHAVELYKSDPDGTDPSLIDTLNTRAVLYERSGKTARAEMDVREGLRIAAQLVGPADRRIANLHNTLGMIASHKGDRRTARAEYDTALKIWLQSSGRNSTEYAATLSNVAGLAHRSGHHDRAEELYRSALQIDEATLGARHPRVASDLTNIAAELSTRKRLDDAIALYERAKEIQERDFGPQSAEVAQTWHSLGVVYEMSKRPNEALRAYETAVAAFKASSPEAPDYAVCLHEYASLLRTRQRFDEAEEAEVMATRVQVKNAIRADQDNSTTPGASSFR